MKKTIAFLLSIFFVLQLSLSFSQEKETGIKFQHGIWSDVLAEAKKQNKIIFVDAYTTWCVPCKWMAKNVFPVETIGDFYNKNFINYKLDMEKGEGIEFAKKYEVKAYPSLLYINPDGEMVHKAVGSRAELEFIDLGKNALNPNTQLITLKKKYGAGERKPGFLKSYAEALSDANENSENVAMEYLKTVNEKDLLTKENSEFILNHVNDINSREFKFFLNNKKKFEEMHGEETVNWKIKSGFSTELNQAAKNKDEQMMLATISKVKSLSAGLDDAAAEMKMDYYQRTKEWNKYADAAVTYTENFLLKSKHSSSKLNNIAWAFYEHIEDKALLEKAEKWAAKSVELDENYGNSDTQGALLAKLGKKNEAVKKLERAIELAKKSGDNYSETEKMLNGLK